METEPKNNFSSSVQDQSLDDALSTKSNTKPNPKHNPNPKILKFYYAN